MLKLPEEIQVAAITYLKPIDLLSVAGVSRHLRRVALPILWGNFDHTNRCARRILRGMLRATPEGVETIKASDTYCLTACSFSSLVE